MDSFWITFAGMTMLALSFLLPALLRRDRQLSASRTAAEIAVYRQRLQELSEDLERGSLSTTAFDTAKLELERALLDSTDVDSEPTAKPFRHIGAAIIVALSVPGLAFTMYNRLGARDAVIESSVQAANQELQLQELRAGIVKLERHLESHPEDGKSWHMLARARATIKDFDGALSAISRAEQLIRDNADLMLDKMQVLAALQRDDNKAEQIALAERALTLAPQSARALWVNSLIALEQGRQTQATDYLQRLLTALPPDDPNVPLVKRQLAALGSGTSQSADAAVPATIAKPSVTIEVTVKLDAVVEKQTKPDDSVFVFARAKNGPKMPLAVVRLQVKDLPKTAILDDNQAMSPQLRLSAFSDVVVGARVSRSGHAVAQNGDFEGYANTAIDLQNQETHKTEVIIASPVP